MKTISVITYTGSLLALVIEAFQYFTVGFGLEWVFMVPLILGLGLVSAFLPPLVRLKWIDPLLQGLANWMILMAAGTFIIWAYVYIRDMPQTVLRGSYYWESGLDIEFRENGTYKAVNSGMGGASAHYGQYKAVGKHLITDHDLYLGIARLKDTLTLDSNGLYFELEEPYRGIEADTMNVELLDSSIGKAN